jgi:gamma-glutamyltranspeptidase/glutathione hydrolase
VPSLTRSIDTYRSSVAEVTSLKGYGAAAVTPHVLATRAALEIMDSRGNAVDGAIAANAVQGVVAPETCGVGGDLFALVHTYGMDAPAVLNASGRAGSGADAAQLRADGHTQIPSYHPQTVTIPGCVDGWHALHERFGNRDLKAVLAPAIRLASDGFPASQELSRALADRHSELYGQLSAQSLFPGGTPPAAGTHLRRPDLAATLTTIADGSRDDFYLGQAGEAITSATGGVVNRDDLARVQAEWVEPLGVQVFGLTGWTVPPNSQGYLTLAAARVFEMLGPPSDPELVDSWHLAIEAYRAMAWDRNEVLADPSHAAVAPQQLTADHLLRQRADSIVRTRAGSFATPAEKPGGTAYMCTIDAQGIGVSLIQSNYMGFGAGICAGTAGFFLQNRGAGFDLRQGHPNELAPDKRPLHTLSPTLWTNGERLACLLGTRGGDYQPQLLLQMAIRIFHGKIEPGIAQSRPRWIVDQLSNPNPRVAVEAHTPKQVIEGLADLGHDVAAREGTQHGWGPVSVITVDGAGLRTVAADPRVDTAHAAVN